MSAFSTFSAFAHAYRNEPFPIVLLGSKHQEDSAICPQLCSISSIKIWDGVGLKIEDLTPWTDHYSLFAQKEWVGITRLEKASKDFLHFITQYIQRPHPHLLLWLFTTDLTCFQSLAKQMNLGASVSLFGEMRSEKETRLAELLSLEAQKLGITCPKQAALAFVEKFPQKDSMYISSEFHKFLCFLGGKQAIEKQDVQAFVTKEESTSLWQFMQALLDRNFVNSHKALQLLISEGGEDPLSLLAFIRSRYMHALRSLEEEPHDRKNKTSLISKRQFFLYAMSELFYAENLIKNNDQDPILTLEMFVSKVTHS